MKPSAPKDQLTEDGTTLLLTINKLAVQPTLRLDPGGEFSLRKPKELPTSECTTTTSVASHILKSTLEMLGITTLTINAQKLDISTMVHTLKQNATLRVNSSLLPTILTRRLLSTFAKSKPLFNHPSTQRNIEFLDSSYKENNIDYYDIF